MANIDSATKNYAKLAYSRMGSGVGQTKADFKISNYLGNITSDTDKDNVFAALNFRNSATDTLDILEWSAALYKADQDYGDGNKSVSDEEWQKFLDKAKDPALLPTLKSSLGTIVTDNFDKLKTWLSDATRSNADIKKLVNGSAMDPMMMMLPMMMGGSGGNSMLPMMMMMMNQEGDSDMSTMLPMMMMMQPQGASGSQNSMLPMMMMMMNKDGDSDISSMLPMMMMMGGQGASGSQNSMLPMMMMMMNKDGDSDMSSMLPMMMMMGGQGASGSQNSMLPMMMMMMNKDDSDSDSMMPMMMMMMMQQPQASARPTSSGSLNLGSLASLLG